MGMYVKLFDVIIAKLNNLATEITDEGLRTEPGRFLYDLVG